MSAKKTTMKGILVSVLKSIFVSFCIAAPVFAVHMQGSLTENGAPVTGQVWLLKYRYNSPTSQTFGTFSPLDSLGRFDLSWTVSINTDTSNPDGIALVYFAPGENPIPGSPISSFKRIFELAPYTGKLYVSPGVSNLPFLTEYSDIYSLDWCGIEIRKMPGASGFEFNATSGWCPEETDRLNTISVQKFASGNRISNGSFENYFPNGYYPGWSTTGLPAGTNSGLNFPMGNLKPRSGTSAFHLQFTTSGLSGEQAVVMSDPFPVKPNTTYNLSFYYSVKNPVNWNSDGFRPRIRTFSEKDGIELSGISGLASGRLGASAYAVSTDMWNSYGHTFITGPSATFASIDMLCYTALSTGGAFYFDDIVVVEDDPAQVSSNMNKFVASTIFANGSGKPIQSRLQNSTKDIYSQTDYDELSRAVKTSLPIGGTLGMLSASNGYLPNAFNQANSLYNGGDGFPNAGGVAYSENQFEASPLGRAKMSSAPGYEWRASGTHTIRKFYSSTGNLTPSGDEPAPATPAIALYAYELTRGEHTQKARQFKNKLGQVIRTEAWNASSGGWVGTDFEYDPNGYVSKVIAPAGPGGARLARTQKFNTLGQVLSESSPDYGENLTVRDKDGRVRFTQSRAQRNLIPPRMNYTKYDALDRVIETGEFLDAAYFTANFANDPDFPSQFEDKRSVRVLNFYDRVPEDKKYCPDGIANQDYIIRSDARGNSMREFRTFDEAFNMAYEDMAGKASFNGVVRLIQVFDSPTQVITPPMGAQYVPLHLYTANQAVGFKILGILRGDSTYKQIVGQPFPFSATWGPLEGRLVETISCSPEIAIEVPGSNQISTVFNYDKYGNVKDLYEFNGYIKDVSKQWQRISKTFDAQNRQISKKIFSDASASTPEVAYAFTYNALGNLDQVTDKNGVVIGKHTYNPLGQLTRVDVGQGAGQVRISYTYHVRGWLKKIEALTPSGTRLFLQDLKYEDASQNPRYDGLVSEYDYATTPATPDKFTFLYGDMDRLTAAMTTAKAAGQSVNPQWSYNYYDNGALSTTMREGQAFSYNYETISAGFSNNTNHLNSVSFAGSFLRNTSQRNNFTYDGSGRMDNDFSRYLSIQYSGNDLPFKFNYINNGNEYTQLMIYDAAGNRRSKLIYLNYTVFVSAIHYMSSGKEIREYDNQPSQEIYPLEAYGRVVKNASGQQEYEAYLKNNIGSTVKIHNINLNVESYRTDYEPYGKLRLQNTTTGVAVTDKFTGKEHDDGAELDYFGARYYDGELGVWISPDAARQHFSPYEYGGNNPVNRVDNTGGFDIPAWVSNNYPKSTAAINEIYLSKDKFAAYSRVDGASQDQVKGVFKPGAGPYIVPAKMAIYPDGSTDWGVTVVNPVNGKPAGSIQIDRYLMRDVESGKPGALEMLQITAEHEASHFLDVNRSHGSTWEAGEAYEHEVYGGVASSYEDAESLCSDH
jgi:RHS repeat-associated protein